MFASITEGHLDLADVLFLIAAVAFIVAFLVRALNPPRAIDALAVPVGLALIAVAFFVL